MKYSLDEIDFMCWALAGSSVLMARPQCTHFANEPSGGACPDCISLMQYEVMDERQNEERLRTLMLNGTTPEELAQRIKRLAEDGGYTVIHHRAEWERFFVASGPEIAAA